MRLSRKALDAYNAAIKEQGGNAEKAARRALEIWFAENQGASVADAREFSIALMGEVGYVYGNAAGDAAYALRDVIAQAEGIELTDDDYEYLPEMEYVEDAAHYQAGKLKTGDTEGFKDGIADASRYFAERGANDTMAHFAEVDKGKARFARVPTGSTTCDYCLMLASRGFVYHSEANALNANHRHCDCRIVEGFAGMEVEGYDPDKYYDMWKHPEKYAQQTSQESKDEIAELAKIDSSKYPSKFTDTKGKRQNFEIFTDAINSVDGADPKVREIFARMDEIIDSDKIPSGNFDVKYSAGRGSVNVYSSRSTGKVTKLTVSVPKMTEENIKGTVTTTSHEFAHFIDLMKGESADRWMSSKYSSFLKPDYLSMPPSERIAAAAARSEQMKPKGKILEVMRSADVRYKSATEEVNAWYRAEYERIDADYESRESKTLEDRKQQLKEYKRLRKEYDSRMDVAHRTAMDGVDKLEDIYDALNEGYLRGKMIDGVEIRYGHGYSYYRTTSKQVEEIWANYCSLSLSRPDLIELLREDQPSLIESMDAMRDDILEGLNG